MTERVLTSLFVTNDLALRSRSKVRVNVKGQVKRLRSNFWRVVVDIRDSACRVQQKTITLEFQARSTITSPWTLSVSL